MECICCVIWLTPNYAFSGNFPQKMLPKSVVVKCQGSSVSLNMVFLNNCLKQTDYLQDAS